MKRRQNWPKGDYWLVDISRCEYTFKEFDDHAKSQIASHLAQLPVITKEQVLKSKDLFKIIKKRTAIIFQGENETEKGVLNLIDENTDFARELTTDVKSTFRDYYFGVVPYFFGSANEAVLFIVLVLQSRSETSGRLIIGEIIGRVGDNAYVLWPSI